MIDVTKINFKKLNGLIPAIVMDSVTEKVLMLGFMNEESLKITIDKGFVTFFSRSRNTLWTKGETSGNFLKLVSILTDCDNDSLLVYAEPTGNTCHTGSYSCFDIEKSDTRSFLFELYQLISQRKQELPEGSYTTKLFRSGENRIIQKVGEEAIETVIAAKNNDKNEIINETADLIYHLLVMLCLRDIRPEEIIETLIQRHGKSSGK